jgi:SPP1 family predicted phage head-tail adaptor
MRIGQLDKLIDILKKKSRRDQKTGETIETFEPYHRKQPASKNDVAGGHGMRGQQVHESASAVFKIRYMRDLDATMRVRCEEVDYEMVCEPLDRDGRGEWLEIQARKI